MSKNQAKKMSGIITEKFDRRVIEKTDHVIQGYLLSETALKNSTTHYIEAWNDAIIDLDSYGVGDNVTVLTKIVSKPNKEGTKWHSNIYQDDIKHDHS